MVAMRALDRKLWRDAWHYRGQMAAIAAVVACGLALFVSLRSMNGYLRASRDAYYRTSRFADVFVSVRRAPMRAADEVRRIAGVGQVDARIVSDAVADVPGLAEPAVVRLVSIAVPRLPALNELHLSTGRWPVAGHDFEVVASRAFATANRLQVGDSVGVVLNGRWRQLRIVGIGISPEYVYEITGASIFPDNRRFGVLWMGRGALAAAFDLEGAFNDLAIALAPGADEQAVIDAVDARMAPHGSVGAYGRSDQVSHQFLDGEIDETQVTSVILPAIFLGITAFLLHVVLSRLVGMQREQVATLKAFGYGNASIAWHYIGLAMVPVGAGIILGAITGLWFAGRLAVVYARFFQFPAAPFTPDWSIVVTAAGIGGGFGLLGALSAVVRGVSLPPAEAMRPEAPARYRRGSLERLAGVFTRSPRHFVIARNIERRPGKTMMTIAGLALAGGLVITIEGMFDSIDFIKTLQFHFTDRGDVTVVFRDLQRRDAVRALSREPGVLEVEGFRAVPVRLRHHAATYRTSVLAYPPDAQLRRVVALDRSVRRVPEEGILLSASLAGRIGARVGDQVQLELLEGDRRVVPLEVSGLNADLLGSVAYIHPAVLRRIEGSVDTYSGTVLRADARTIDVLYQRLKTMPAVAGVNVRRATLEGFERTIAESFNISLVMTLGFALVMAGGIVYNSARVALSERGRELASLRILGFTQREVSGMLLGEQVLLTVASFPVAFVVAYFFTWLIVIRFESTLYRIPIVTRPVTYAIGVAVVSLATLLTALAVRRRIGRLDLIAVLKTRE